MSAARLCHFACKGMAEELLPKRRVTPCAQQLFDDQALLYWANILFSHHPAKVP